VLTRLILGFIGTIMLGFTAAPYDSYASSGTFQQLVYSGRILTPSGAPVNGTVDLEIKFYHVATGGVAQGSVYEFTAAPVSAGTFSVVISMSAADMNAIMDAGSNIWIEVYDRSNGKIYPRQKLGAVPFAQRIPIKSDVFRWDGPSLDLTNTCSDGQLLKFSSGEWTCGSDLTTGSGGLIGEGDIDTDAITTTKIDDGTIVNVGLDGVIGTIVNVGLDGVICIWVGRSHLRWVGRSHLHLG